MSAETMLHRLRLFLLALALLIFAGTVVELWFTEHIEHNLAFELEIRPNATAAEGLWMRWVGLIRCWPPVFWRWPPSWRWPRHITSQFCWKRGQLEILSILS